MTTTKDKQRSLELRIHTPQNSPLGKTIKYLMESEEWTAKEGRAKASLAITAFFLPEAQRLTNPEQARISALQAIYHLENQIRRLRREFGITDSNLSTDVDIAPTGAVRTPQSPLPDPPTPQPIDIFSMEEMQALNDSIFE